MSGVRHLYVHMPFCAHRCGYCDFVTLVGARDQHEAYIDAVLGELRLDHERLAPKLDTIFLGGGTPTFTEPRALARLLRSLPRAREVTIEANPETVTPELAASLHQAGVNRVSLGAQSFRPHLLETLERIAQPETVKRAFHTLREAGFDNLSLDLIYGIPGQTAADVEADLRDALSLSPEHMSWYEIEAKPGTRFTHAHGAELERQRDAMETYFERVVERLIESGYRWYETANFCRAGGRDLRSQHNLAYWHGRDYLGLGIGAVTTIGDVRWRNTPRLSAYLAAVTRGERPPRDVEPLDDDVRLRERLMLGLRLDEPVRLAALRPALDAEGLERMTRLGLASVSPDGDSLALTVRGRHLGGGVTAELLA